MALIRRFSRLLTADVHAMLDRLEEPQAVLRQAIREMEDELERLDDRIRATEAEIESGDKRIDALGRTVTDTDRKLDLCFDENGDDVLARRLVRRKLETQRLIQRLRERRGTLTADMATLTSTATRQRDELEGLRQKAALFSDPEAGPIDGCEGHDDTIDETDVEIALVAERRARQRS